MVAFFGMIVEAFTWFMAFFGRISAFFTSQAVATNLRFAIRLSLMTSFRIAFLTFITSFVAFIVFAFAALVKIYNLISNIINMMHDPSSVVGSGSGSSILQGAFFLLHTSGVADALSNVFPIIASALTFVLTRNAYRLTLYFYKEMFRLYFEVVKLITMA